MTTEHIGVVTGLSDLANFLAALRRRTGAIAPAGDIVKIVLFGGFGSLPAGLMKEFMQVAADAFPEARILLAPPERVSGSDFDSEGYVEPQLSERASRRIVYGNAIHKPFHQSFYAFLAPDEFVFFDNGLSSYWRHDADIKSEFERYGVAFPSEAFLSLSPGLPTPPYLSAIPQTPLDYADYAEIYARIAMAARIKPPGGWLANHVVLGTSLFRIKRISWEEERDIYRRLIDAIRREKDAAVTFKAHPRASDRPLLTEADGADVLETGVPVEAFIKPGATGRAYSISSTSLFTMQHYFGWTAYRLDSPAARLVIKRSPHLGMINMVETLAV